jgi:putative ABC transport system ATP-binding protein
MEAHRKAAEAVAVHKVYGSGDTAVRALDGVDVSFANGEFAAVMGPSGSGKSTLLHCMAGLDDLTSGRVEIGGVDLTTFGDKALTRLRRDRIGFVFQAFNLVPTLNAHENIVLPLSLGGASPDQEWLTQIIDTMGLADRLTHRPGELSGGQQQRVATARALVTRPDIVFADEPTGNLDSISSADMMGFLRSAVDDFGQSIVMVTHDAKAAAYADRVVFMLDGKLVNELHAPTAGDILDTLKTLDGRTT